MWNVGKRVCFKWIYNREYSLRYQWKKDLPKLLSSVLYQNECFALKSSPAMIKSLTNSRLKAWLKSVIWSTADTVCRKYVVAKLSVNEYYCTSRTCCADEIIIVERYNIPCVHTCFREKQSLWFMTLQEHRSYMKSLISDIYDISGRIQTCQWLYVMWDECIFFEFRMQTFKKM